MKKHLIGFTIFAFIVGSFAFIWALFGYFTQTIPNVPKVESDNLPVFKYDRRKNCRMKREKISHEVVNSYYFADENVVISKINLKWNGYGSRPEAVSVIPKIYTANYKTSISGSGTYFRDIFENGREVDVTVRTFPSETEAKELLKGNFYSDFVLTTEYGTARSNFSSSPQQVIVVHGTSSIIKP